MKSIKKQLFKIKDDIKVSESKDLLNTIAEYFNTQGRLGKTLGNLSIDDSDSKDDTKIISCVEFLSDDEYAVLVKNGDVQPNVTTTKSTEESTTT